MREIKFRTYIEEVDSVQAINEISWNDDGAFDFGVKDTADWYSSEDYVLEQYTGLKDKNGVEIYEGDIVEILDNLGGMGEVELTYKVKWNNELCQFVLNGINNNNYNLSFVRFDVEIIGNIHENKEV